MAGSGRWTAWAVVAALGGCVAVPPEPAREIAAPSAAVRGRVEEALRRLQLVPRSASDGQGVAATIGNAPTDWARCRPMLVGDSDDRFRMVTATARRGGVTVLVAPTPGGSRVRVEPRFAATYRNPINGTSFESTCESTGALEARLLDAAAGTAAAAG